MALYAYCPVKLWPHIAIALHSIDPHTAMALYSYDLIQLWPYTVIALYSYGLE